MKVIAQRVWGEPAVAVGLLVSLALFVVNLLAGENFDAALIVTIVGPLAASLGIRQLVTPVADEPTVAHLEGRSPVPPPE